MEPWCFSPIEAMPPGVRKRETYKVRTYGRNHSFRGIVFSTMFVVFANITKYIKMGASSNFGNMFSMLGASIFLPFLPMAPIQVLTNNLLYDFSQTTIPTDNVDEEYLASPRKWDIGNIFKFMVFIGPISSIFDYATYGMMLYVFDAWNNPALFQTGWFVESL
jgi:P-type Mg2+ transporter